MQLKPPLILVCSAAGVLAADETIPAPRYRFEAGQELNYDATSDFKFTNGSHRSVGSLTLWITRQNADGSWHVLGHSESEFLQSRNGQTEALPAQKSEEFDAFDVSPNGTILNKPERHGVEQLTAPFFRLPTDLDTACRGWEVQGEDSGDTLIYRLDEKSDLANGRWIFEQTSKGLFNEIYLMASKSRIHLDASRGFVTDVDSEYSQGWGFNGKGTGRLHLKSAAKKDSAWITRFAEEASLFLSSNQILMAAYKEAKTSSEALPNAHTSVRASKAKATLPFIQGQFDRLIAQINENAKYFADEQNEEREVQDQAAPDWKTTDLDGRAHALGDYRGKVLLLDFWYRGCGWCIRAMPQIKEIADHFRGKPFAVLGMNTDRDTNDARFVVDKLQLNYSTLKAEDLPDKYKVRGFPTLIFIDQDGIIRGRHVGYSKTLRDDVIKEIDTLLGRKKE